MSKIAYFDCFSGISGDMILGALVDAGLEMTALRGELDKMSLPGWAIRAERVKRGGITATRVEVQLSGGQNERRLPDILGILKRSGLDRNVSDGASKVFNRLAEAEAKIHGITPEQVHFHEVGATDALIDVVGTLAGLRLLGVESVFASSLRLGKGCVQCRHGTLPVPAPATVELLRDLPIELTDVEAELVTPTGAAIIASLSQSFGSSPPLHLERIGYGAGERDSAKLPNVLRVLLGRELLDMDQDRVLVMETNIDDMSPELYGPLLEDLFEKGALDASLMPVVMKKGRPGVLLTVLAADEKAEAISRLIFRHTSTLGLRFHRVERRKLPRQIRRVKTPWGTLRVKVATFEKQERISPEFDDCLRVARERSLPLWQVYQGVQEAWRKGELENGEE